MGDDPVRFGVQTDVRADLASPGHLLGGGAGEVHGLSADLIRLTRARSKWAHVQ